MANFKDVRIVLDKTFGPNYKGRQKVVYIYIGDYYASSCPALIYTLLGSCVAVCLFDPVNQVGGMNHILIPGKADMKHFDDSARYGINAMELLINRIMNLGGRRRRLTAKIFGGAHTLSAISKQNSMGRKNIDFAIKFLETERIRIISQDVGGTQSRRVYFYTGTGDAFLKRGPFVNQSILSSQEQKKSLQIQEAYKKSGEIILF